MAIAIGAEDNGLAVRRPCGRKIDPLAEGQLLRETQFRIPVLQFTDAYVEVEQPFLNAAWAAMP